MKHVINHLGQLYVKRDMIHYKKIRDTRTLSMFSKCKLEEFVLAEQQHIALADAKAQAQWVMAMLRDVKGVS